MSVGAPFFNIAFTPFMVLLACILPIGATLSWKRTHGIKLVAEFQGLLILSISVAAAVWTFQTGGRMLAPIGIALSVWVIFGSLLDLLKRIKFFSGSIFNSITRLYKMPRSDFGKSTAHIGFGLIVFGISAVSAWELEDIRVVNLNEAYSINDYSIKLTKVREFSELNYVVRQGVVVVKKGDRVVTTLFPEKRFYPVQSTSTTEAAIDTSLLRDIYIVLGDKKSDETWVVRTYIKPFIIWIWIGSLTIAAGGALSLTDRRYRLATVNKKNSDKLLKV
jgi:cytochrome c-type biogenesis protein CcmF